jgi:hypothetical protein
MLYFTSWRPVAQLDSAWVFGNKSGRPSLAARKTENIAKNQGFVANSRALVNPSANPTTRREIGGRATCDDPVDDGRPRPSVPRPGGRRGDATPQRDGQRGRRNADEGNRRFHGGTLRQRAARQSVRVLGESRSDSVWQIGATKRIRIESFPNLTTHRPTRLWAKPCQAVRCKAKLRPSGIEPATCGLEVRCSIRLSYGR